MNPLSNNKIALGIMGLGAALVLISLTTGCSSGPKAFKDGEYGDASQVILLNDQFNESDLRRIADTMAEGLNRCRALTNTVAPTVSIDVLNNRTSESIDMSMLANKIKLSLVKMGRARVVDRADREVAAKEYEYTANGATSSVMRNGSQYAIDYVLKGDLSSVVQAVGRDKTIYYVFTLSLVNLKTTSTDCVEEKELRKNYELKGL